MILLLFMYDISLSGLLHQKLCDFFRCVSIPVKAAGLDKLLKNKFDLFLPIVFNLGRIPRFLASHQSLRQHARRPNNS